MVYKAYILQYAPPTNERVNIGIMASDGEKHIQKYIPQDSIDIFDSVFGGNVSSFLRGLWKTSEWTEADWWPDEWYFESMGTAMSLIKVHSVEPIVSIGDRKGVSLERFGNRMYEQFCVMPRQGLWGNGPEAIAARQTFPVTEEPVKGRILPGGGLVETITCQGCLVRSKADGPDDPRTPICSHPGCYRVSNYKCGFTEEDDEPTEICIECNAARCPYCGGSPYHKANVCRESGYQQSETQAVCPACNGTGEVSFHGGRDLCEDCEGSGTLTLKETDRCQA